MGSLAIIVMTAFIRTITVKTVPSNRHPHAPNIIVVKMTFLVGHMKTIPL